MRLIGHLNNETSARTFADYLTSIEVRNMVEPDNDGTWAVWVHVEEQLESARKALADFLQNPDDLKYRLAPRKAAAITEKEQREAKEFAGRVRTKEMIWRSTTIGPLTLVLIIVCVGVSVAHLIHPEWQNWLYISEFMGKELPEVHHGEYWRLLTPIFIHFGIIHLAFNMLAMRTLGTVIEVRMGTWKLALMIVVMGVGSNLCQYYFSGPGFGGMSGVLYGLFGYIWIRGKYDPSSGLALDPESVKMMLIWFFLCLFGFLGRIANGAHTGGLIIGIIWGYAPVMMRRLS